MNINERIRQLEAELEVVRREIASLLDARLNPSAVAPRLAELVPRKKELEAELCNLRNLRSQGVEEV